MLKMLLICHSQPTFFGLTSEYVKHVYEQMFYLKQYGGWSFAEAYSLPIQLREWWLERLGKEFEKEREQIEKAKNKNSSSRR